MAPGNRADLLVSMAAGTSVVQVLPYDRGAAMGTSTSGMGGAPAHPTLSIAALSVGGPATAAATAAAAGPAQPPRRDLRTEPVSLRRQVTFAMGMAGGMGMGGGGMAMTFTIDRRKVDPQRIDQSVPAGAVQEWTLSNISPMDQPMHLYVWPMIIAQQGVAVTPVTWQDVVNILAHRQLAARIALETFAGTTAHHCHILEHEDQGMMATVQVQ